MTPALSDSMPDICMEACETAKNAGIKIICDLNYRGNLWSSEKASAVMGKLMKYVDICIANEEDADKVFGIKVPFSCGYALLQHFYHKYPHH
jgi:2-dehydro-3-deoxygluconokinase